MPDIILGRKTCLTNRGLIFCGGWGEGRGPGDLYWREQVAYGAITDAVSRMQRAAGYAGWSQGVGELLILERDNMGKLIVTFDIPFVEHTYRCSGKR